MTSLASRFHHWATDWNPYDPKRLKAKGDGIEPVLLEESEVRRSAVRVVVIAFIGFFVWATVAPLDSGVVITGNVTVSGNRKAVQHPTGGVVQDLLVREGSQVKQGDVVLKVNPLDSEANLTGAELQYINLLATESRLLSERTGAAAIRWKPELEAFGANDTRLAEAKLVQLQLFSSRRQELDSQQRILREQLSGQQAQAESLVKVAQEKKNQLELVEREARNTVQLAKEGYVPESRANEVLRSQSSLQSDMANLIAEASRTRASMSSTSLQMAQQRTTFLKDIDNQLSELQKNREAYMTRMESLKFARNLTEVKAPVSGTVVGLKVNTVGGVITASQVLMEILPEEGNLIIEAQVPPTSIDKVHVGLEADVRFSAFNQRNTPVVPGVIKLVGADKQKDPSGGANDFYLAQIETTKEGLQLLGHHKIQPGMPAEVIVKTGERSFLTYLLKPLSDRFARSFKED